MTYKHNKQSPTLWKKNNNNNGINEKIKGKKSCLCYNIDI
uniref:Uncharacterized protein n=1 Tax=Anguilla anguilla TaxID=7936 RepID=A0A0E9V3H0_ANGAN